MRSTSRIKEFPMGGDGEGPFYYEDERGRICSKEGVPFRNAEMRTPANPRRPAPASVHSWSTQVNR